MLLMLLIAGLVSATALRIQGSKREKSAPVMINRLLLVLGATLAMAGIIYASAVALLVHGLSTADPYPPFMGGVIIAPGRNLT
jgi:hypothetical protein